MNAAEKSRDTLRAQIRSSTRTQATELTSYADGDPNNEVDGNVPRTVIKQLISDGDLGIGEIVGWFRDQLIEELG